MTQTAIELLGVAPRDIAHACRLAALEFLRFAPWGDRRMLAEWLVRRYAPLTSWVPRPARAVPEHRAIDIDEVAEIMSRARARVVHELTTGDEELLAARAQCRNHVHETKLSSGTSIFLPVDADDARLEERVLSLLAVDYLTCPEEHEALLVCDKCEGVSFEDKCPYCSTRRSGFRGRF